MITMSDREMLIAWDVLCGAVWGGPDLLWQSELWDAFGLDTRFKDLEGAQTVDARTLSDEQHEYELSPQAVEVLCAILRRPGQARVMGQSSAAALRRLTAKP